VNRPLERLFSIPHLVNQIEITPVPGPITTTVRPPGSKSLTNRALVCAGLAEGESFLQGVLESEDTNVMAEGLARLGIALDWNREARTIRVAGQAGRISVTRAELYIANSGTTVRFLTALVGLGQGVFRLHGTTRMHERPIQDLLESLSSLGVDAVSEDGNGCPPVVVAAAGIAGGEVSVRGNVSSQFLSALLMIAPYAKEPLHLDIKGELVSRSYVEMTLAVMRQFGIEGVVESSNRISVPRGIYQAQANLLIEPDASAASYWWGLAAITGGKITVPGLSKSSLQGDVGFCDVLAKMGCKVDFAEDGITVAGGPLKGVDVDMNTISDTVQTLAAVALFATGPTRVRNVAHNRHKETDRIGNLAAELRKTGAQIEEHDDGLTIHPIPLASLRPATFATYHDHRMAMSLALIGLRVPGVVITDPGCTEKTYPKFFADLARVCAS
jgi:3-phosphoshikimate 1-carboxyvinyltransferase